MSPDVEECLADSDGFRLSTDFGSALYKDAFVSQGNARAYASGARS
jgi:hypothetical protein